MLHKKIASLTFFSTISKSIFTLFIRIISLEPIMRNIYYTLIVIDTSKRQIGEQLKNINILSKKNFL